MCFSLLPVMCAAVVNNGALIVRSDYPTPRPTGEEALIRVRLAGVCATDIELLRGYKGGFEGVLGHEFVGEVVHAPADPSWEGRRVVGEINVGCGQCMLCRRGLAKHCRQRTSLGIIGRDGVFAEYTLLPLQNLHPVPDSLPDEVAVFTEPLAAAYELLEQASIGPGHRVIVVGDGRLGLLCAFVLAQTGCDLTVVGRNPEKLALLASTSARTLLASPDALDRLAEEPADIVVDATGAREGFFTALRLVRPLGVLMLKSTFADRLQAFDLSRLVVDEVTIIGSRCGPFQPALTALSERRIDPRPLIHAEYRLEDAARAIARAGEKGVLKVLIRP
ncbi:MULTISPECIES: MDR/zinc-dependent alcohol dehydrogenase-like family protein [Caldilinea]|jgi:threonine dehydrogenase-like Zn-dependent dehydrogenase|uniref:MDR/zinc-dependent alcohol dehydrogenase-like family protein n=1 Tax=Caldilinea TaxID=233191 RepID=UPI0018D36659|nr:MULTISPECIES: alcohol dehydrogenase catalytic domain-containing protein [Caldilinea]MBO9392175.1 alcohol dehydrogenase catalytic domain-containing protein [Caldilinea sp.]